mmetsp:Transcript_6558/g.8310  ORF Transcript_6558/g.8310 Transcript_6558/m.8310 type:complete len:89 (+) Transcript_6558:222-488(+)
MDSRDALLRLSIFFIILKSSAKYIYQCPVYINFFLLKVTHHDFLPCLFFLGCTECIDATDDNDDDDDDVLDNFLLLIYFRFSTTLFSL